MDSVIVYFLTGIFYVCALVMHAAAIINGAAEQFMENMGILPLYQLYIFVGLFIVLSVLALRVLRGFPGWVVVLLLVLLLVERIVPGLSSPGTLVLHPLVHQL